MFWSGNKLKQNLAHLIENSEGNTAGIEVDCAAISLTVGNEIYVTPNGDKDPSVKQILDDKKPQFIIPKGQFALLITAEIIKVPVNALAFFSLKANISSRA